jgi:hypothetical protein
MEEVSAIINGRELGRRLGLVFNSKFGPIALHAYNHI